MGFHLFGRSDGCGTRIRLPEGNRTTLRWLPRLGDVFPDFTAQTTFGELTLHDWAGGSWVYLFSHPAAFAPVCSTEILDVASQHGAFERRGIKPMSIGCCSAERLAAWADDIERVFDVPVCFPMAADPRGLISRSANMIHPRQSQRQPIRKSFLMDPQMRIRMIFEYPMEIGRNVDEVLRTAAALQTAEKTGMLVPGGWDCGDPLLAAQDMPDGMVSARVGAGPTEVRRYLRVVQPRFDPVVVRLHSAGDPAAE